MNIIAHRGQWTMPQEQNTEKAFERAFLNGFGIEFDIRDHNQSLVVSHDMPAGQDMPLAYLLEMHARLAPSVTLAINIKADGLAEELLRLTEKFRTRSYFAFDMSVPDMRHYLNAAMPCLARHSEYEPFTPFHEQAHGVWFDSFSNKLPDISLIKRCLNESKIACVVSAELHGSAHYAQWASLEHSGLSQTPGLMLCTDEPDAAQEAFNV